LGIVIRRIAMGVGVSVAVLGTAVTTGASGFFDSVIFWCLVGGLIAAFGVDRADKAQGRR
jgi:hypothetical protein